MDQRNYYLMFLILLVAVAWYQHFQMIQRIDELENMIDECTAHNFDLLDNRITELESKIDEVESKNDDFDSRIDDLETKTMFMD